MTKDDFLTILSNHAKKYKDGACKSLIRNCHMNNLEEDHKVDKDIVEAAVIDFINYIGAMWGVDYGIYTRDLNDPCRFNKSVDVASDKTLEDFEDAVLGLYQAEQSEYANPNREDSYHARERYQRLRSEVIKQMEVKDVVP